MLTATQILGTTKRLLKPSDVLCPVDLDSLAERIAALSVRAHGTSAGATLGWDTRHQWQPAHPEGDPAGLPSGKIKHAVLVIGGKRYKGPSHFQVMMDHALRNPDKHLDIGSIQHEGFETESGHFLDRMQAADYALHLKQREPGYLHTLCSEELRLAARDGQLYTQDAVQGTHVAPTTLPDAHGTLNASQGQGHPGSSATVHGAEQVNQKPLSRDFQRGENEIQASLISSASAGATPTPATILAREPVSTCYDPRNEAEAKHAEAVKKALAVAEASALANAKEKDEAKAKRRREEAAALALLLLGAAGAASYALLAPHLLRVAVAGAPSQGPLPTPSAPATLPEAPAPAVTLPNAPEAPTPAQTLGITVSPPTPEPAPVAEPTPEQEADMLDGRTLEKAAEDFADERAEFLKPFCADIQEAMRLEVEVGKANGESIHQIGRRLFDLAQGVYGSRGAVLAATEAQSAYGHAQLRALAAAGYRTANWVQVDRPTKRESHAENVLAGPLPIGDTWPNGQKFPGDPIGGPEECINCLCELTGADWHKPKPERVLTRRQQLRKERLAKRNTSKASDQTESGAVKAASPECGCLMAMLPELNSGIADVASRIEPDNLAEDGVETEAHATALYGFSMDFNSQRLIEVLRGFGPFEVKLGKLSRFECPEYDVVKFDVHSDKLRALNARIAEQFNQDITPSKWDYNPHVTVAYVKKGAAQGLDGSSLEGRKIEVQDLIYSLPEKKGRVEFKLSAFAKASEPAAGDTVQAVHIKEYERKTKSGGIAEVHEHEDKRTKQAAPVPMGQVGDKAKELAAGVTWKHGGEKSESSAAKAPQSDKSDVHPAKDTSEAKSARVQRAKDAHHLVDRKIQRYAEEHNEPAFAKSIGGASFRDNEAVDIVLADDTGRVAHGIELKTIVSNKSQKITMKGEALARKRSWERKNKATIHTVVLDDALVFNAKGNGKHDLTQRKIYYRRGYGSFRLESMYQVKDLDELKSLLTIPKRSLPKGAK